MRRIPALIALPLAFAVALLVAACGGGGSGGGGGGGATTSRSVAGSGQGTATTTTTTTTTVTRTSTAAAGPGTVEVFFVEGEHLKAVHRTVARQAPARGAMLQLLEGPQGTGLTSEIPSGTTLNSVHIENGIATVDLSKTFESGGGSFSMLHRVAQVVYTLTQFESASLVRFYIEGKPAVAIGGEGVLVDKPVGRAQFSEYAPLS